MIFFHLGQKCQKLWRGLKVRQGGCARSQSGGLVAALGQPVSRGLPGRRYASCFPPTKGQWLFLARARNSQHRTLSIKLTMILWRLTLLSCFLLLAAAFPFHEVNWILDGFFYQNWVVPPSYRVRDEHLKLLQFPIRAPLRPCDFISTEHEQLPWCAAETWSPSQPSHLAIQRCHAGDLRIQMSRGFCICHLFVSGWGWRCGHICSSLIRDTRLD